MVRGTVLGLIAALAVSVAAPGPTQTARAKDTIRIGELNSYNRMSVFTVPYRNGWQLALDEVNAAGGVLGRKLEIVSRDDGGTTGDAVRVADELVSREGVVMIFGTYLSNVGLAVADLANQRQVVFFAAEPLTDALTMDKGNRYTFRMRPNTYMQTAMLVQAAKELRPKKWAIVAPNYEYGHAAAEAFRTLIVEAVPGSEIVVEQYPALGKVDAGATIGALEQANPDALFNVLFAGDLTEFVREGQTRGFFEGKTTLSLLTGEPEYLIPLRDEAPEGWIVTGYPWDQIDTPEHKAFVDAYQAAFGESPRLGSLLGYVMVKVIAQAMDRAGSTETDAMIEALEGGTFDTPIGPISIRASDHQASFGAWVGRIVVEDGSGRMTDWQYLPGDDFMHTEDEVRAARGG